MDAKCNRLMQSESRKVLKARKASFYICLGPMLAGADKTLHSLQEACWRNVFFCCGARFYQNTTKRNTFRKFGVQVCTHSKMYWLQDGSFVDRCGARMFHSLHLHFEISSQLPPLSSKLALPQTQKWLVAKYQYSSSRDQRQKHQGMHKLYSVWYTFLQT